jgi:hypothetical protein
MKAKKTFSVAEFKDACNNTLASDFTCHPKYREGIIIALEHVLHATGNYRGYSYLTKDQVPNGELPGINTPIEELSYEDRFKNTDYTRRYYS